MAKKKFLKLGSGRTTFYDPTTKVDVSNAQVKAVDESLLNHPHIKASLDNGHLKEASETEFKDHVDTLTYEEKLARGDIEDKPSIDPKKKLKKEKPVEVEPEEDEEDVEVLEDPDDYLTKSDMIDFLKASPLVKEDQKPSLTKLKDVELKNLYEKIKGSK